MAKTKERTSTSKVWYDEEEQLVKKWAMTAQLKSTTHRMAARTYLKKSRNMTITTLFLQTCCGSFTLAASNGSISTQYEAFVAGLQLLLACLVSISGYLKLESKGEAHRGASLSYAEVYRRLTTIIVRRPDERPNVASILESTQATLIQLEKVSPLLPQYLCDKITRKPDVLSIPADQLPEELIGICPVIVYGESLEDNTSKREAPRRRPRSPKKVPRPIETPPPPLAALEVEEFISVSTEPTSSAASDEILSPIAEKAETVKDEEEEFADANE